MRQNLSRTTAAVADRVSSARASARSTNGQGHPERTYRLSRTFWAVVDEGVDIVDVFEGDECCVFGRAKDADLFAKGRNETNEAIYADHKDIRPPRLVVRALRCEFAG